MTQRTKHISLAIVAVLLAGTGLMVGPALLSAPTAAPVPSAAATGPASSASGFDKENMVAMDRMMKDMHVASTGNVDLDFTRMMIPHHQGAVDMAEALLRHGKNQELKALARGIIAKQREEIALMRRIGDEIAPAVDPAQPAEHNHKM
jgi:hypothetical protein